jgi:SAM-dependent methyltransferase
MDGLGGYDQSFGGRLIHALVPPGVVDIIIPRQDQGKLLDVGCGDGERVEWYRQRGFDAHGIETSARAVEHATSRGLNVREGTLTAVHYADEAFDVVVMAHVLEHTHSPRMYLQEAFRILKPGGTLAVAVPNIDSQSAKAFGASWQLLMPPLHLFHFSVETLSQFLVDTGFEIERFVGKVYPGIIKSSVSVARVRSPLWPALAAWRRAGYFAVQQLRFGVVGADAITAYCSKPG